MIKKTRKRGNEILKLISVIGAMLLALLPSLFDSFDYMFRLVVITGLILIIFALINYLFEMLFKFSIIGFLLSSSYRLIKVFGNSIAKLSKLIISVISFLRRSNNSVKSIIKQNIKLLKKSIDKTVQFFAHRQEPIRKATLTIVFTLIFIFIFIGVNPNEQGLVYGVVGGDCAYDSDCDLCEDCSVCPDGWSNQWQGRCYQTVSSDTWSNVETDCSALGGSLAKPDNSSEWTHLKNNYGAVWIGYNDEDNDNSWTWTQGGSGYINWATDEGIAQQGDCALMQDDGTYFNKTCNSPTYTGLCEIAATCGALTNGVEDIWNGCYDYTGCSATSGDYCRCYGDNICLTENEGDCTDNSDCNSTYCDDDVQECAWDAQDACDTEIGAVCDSRTCYNTSWLWNDISQAQGTYYNYCCGDDATELFNISSYASTMESSPATTEACCDSATDCVNGSSCYEDGNNSMDLDADGDNDYCNAGTWIDCNDNIECLSNHTCIENDCVFEDIIIRNLGQIGFSSTNQEYTPIRTVILLLAFDNTTATYCRYKNSGENYDNWEDCVAQKYWLLSSGYGLKQVFYQVNHSDTTVTTYNDTIYYNYTGAGLDTTPPTAPIITDGDYTNVINSLYVSWSNASDPESDLLNIPLMYNYYVYVDGSLNTTGTTTNAYFNETGLNFDHNNNITVNITVVNSAGLTSSSVTDGLVIDLLDPLAPTINSTHPENVWNSTSTVSFNWNTSDNVSGIYAYSYIISSANSDPDNIPEGTIGNLANELSKTYSSLADGTYHFKVKARDKAGNWGNVSNYTLKIDSSPPARPTLISETFNSAAQTIVYNYTNISDLSGIILYEINITNVTGQTSTIYNNSNATTFQLNDTSHTNYYFRIRVKNGAQLWSIWSDQTVTVSDITRPAIWAKPSGDIVSRTPIFVVKTTETAICKYSNKSDPGASDFTNFSYTNSTFHETKVTSDGGTFNITCTDLYGNVNSTSIAFNYTSSSLTSSPTLVSDQNFFINEYINITVDTSEDYGEIPKSSFKVYMGDAEIKDFSLFDEGYGNYTVMFEAPSVGKAYTVNVTIGSVSDALSIDVYNLTLTVNYTKAGMSPLNKTRTVYNEYQNYTVGFTTDSELYDTFANNNLMRLKSYIEDNALIIVTDRIDGIDRKEDMLKEKRFFDLFTPSFGYRVGEYNNLKIILNYPNYIINGSEEIFRGQYSLLIKNVRPSSGNKKVILVTTELSETSETGVYSYEG